MFQSLFSWWKEDILLKKALEESALALEKAGNMVSFAVSVLLEGGKEEKKIYEMDQEVNILQRNVRKKVLEHLAIHPKQDITASLVLTTIVVDIERIGDFAKNIVELHKMFQGEPKDSEYRPNVENIIQKLTRLLKETKEAFSKADSEKAKKLMEEYTWTGRECDRSLESLVSNDSLKVREAVAYGLLFRYLKRISAHGRNISSSLVNPFDRLGFKPE